MRRRVPLLLLLAACGTTPAAGAGAESSSGQPTPSGSTSTDSTTSSTESQPAGSSSTTEVDETVGVSFITVPDGGPASIECSIFEQDCPRGEKCNAWANDGGSAWNATRCVPLSPDPDDAGEVCTVTESGVSGLDSCDVGSLCWDLDARTAEGTCTPYCVGAPPQLSCQDPNRVCIVGAKAAVLSLCFPQCSPLDPDACDAGLGCYALVFPAEGVFRCGIDDSDGRGAAFDPCDNFDDCDPGLGCTDSTAVGEACPVDAESCCTPFCDLQSPECPEGTECIPYFPERSAPPIHESLGSCGQPLP